MKAGSTYLPVVYHLFLYSQELVRRVLVILFANCCECTVGVHWKLGGEGLLLRNRKKKRNRQKHSIDKVKRH